MPDRDSYPSFLGSRRQPLKGGGGIKTKPIAQPITMKNILLKLVAPAAVILRSILKNLTTTLIGVAVVILGVFDGTEPNVAMILSGISAIFARNAWTSSQESGIRGETIKKPAPL